MALDFIIYNDDQTRLLGHVPIGVDSHWAIVERARELELVLVSRFRDYYDNTRFEAAELPHLIEELQVLAATFTAEPQVRMCLGLLVGLAELGIVEGRPVIVFAD